MASGPVAAANPGGSCGSADGADGNGLPAGAGLAADGMPAGGIADAAEPAGSSGGMAIGRRSGLAAAGGTGEGGDETGGTFQGWESAAACFCGAFLGGVHYIKHSLAGGAGGL